MRIPLLFHLIVLLIHTPIAFASDAPRPNILIIVADDLGYADVGFNGGEIRTPAIDSIAAAGAKLSQFYVQPVCSPTRAALMTGRYPIRYGFQVGVVRPWAQYGLPLEERMLSVALKEAGYSTAIVGKWHLGHIKPEYLPTRRGFDHQYGCYNGAIDYFTHDRDGGLDWHRDDKAVREEGYATELIGSEAVRLIKAHEGAKPLFLYVPFNAVHSPHQVPEKYKEPYAKFSEPRRTYAGMLAAMDEQIGRILAAMEEKKLRDNTLILFSADNGGPAPGKVTSNGQLRAGKGSVYEGGVRAAACVAWKGQITAGTTVSQPLHIVDVYPTVLRLIGRKLDQPLPLDGKDAWPTIARGEASPHAEILINATPMNGAIRMGDWKLVVNGKRPESDDGGEGGRQKGRGRQRNAPPSDEVELFNLADDPAESKNLASAQPEKVKELRTRYDALANEAVPFKSRPKADGFTSPKVWGELD